MQSNMQLEWMRVTPAFRSEDFDKEVDNYYLDIKQPSIADPSEDIIILPTQAVVSDLVKLLGTDSISEKHAKSITVVLGDHIIESISPEQDMQKEDGTMAILTDGNLGDLIVTTGENLRRIGHNTDNLPTYDQPFTASNPAAEAA